MASCNDVVDFTHAGTLEVCPRSPSSPAAPASSCDGGASGRSLRGRGMCMQMEDVLQCTYDLYDGVVVDADALPTTSSGFAARLTTSLYEWRATGRRGVWLKVRAAATQLTDRERMGSPTLQNTSRSNLAAALGYAFAAIQTPLNLTWSVILRFPPARLRSWRRRLWRCVAVESFVRRTFVVFPAPADVAEGGRAAACRDSSSTTQKERREECRGM
jgi:hypothetical protein